jgi:hypothetical protein
VNYTTKNDNGENSPYSKNRDKPLLKKQKPNGRLCAQATTKIRRSDYPYFDLRKTQKRIKKDSKIKKP